MIDQAENLRKTIEEYRKKKQSKQVKQVKVIAVASGKGGVGKTNFSVNLAIALREIGNNVVVLDADLGLANVDVIIGVVPRLNLYDVIFNNKSIEDIIINGPSGIKVVPGGSGIESLSNLNDDQRRKLSEKFGQLKDTDILIIDTGAGISKNVLGFLAASDEVIIVTTPEPTSITDAYSLVKVAMKYIPKTKLHVIVNRALNDNDANLAYQRLASAVRNFLKREINYLGYVVDDVSVKKAVREQTPFKVAYPDSYASRCIDEIASVISGLPVSAVKRPGGVREFMNKVAYLFSRLDH